MTLAKNNLARSVHARLLIFAGLVMMVSAAAADQPLSKKFILRDSPKPVQAIQFIDGEGKSRNVADFRGKTILLTIWATWCVPCRKEMPALDRLQTALGGPDFQVIPLSIDRGGIDVVRKFHAEVGIQKLGMFLDASGDASRKLSVVGLPTTILIDPKSREVGRLIGPADWDTPENLDFIKCITVANGGKPSGDSTKPGPAHCGGRTVHFPASSAAK